MVRVFNKQVEEDRRIVISRSNLNELNKVSDSFCIDDCCLVGLYSSVLKSTRR